MLFKRIVQAAGPKNTEASSGMLAHLRIRDPQSATCVFSVIKKAAILREASAGMARSLGREPNSAKRNFLVSGRFLLAPESTNNFFALADLLCGRATYIF